jgi:hypothetical protein
MSSTSNKKYTTTFAGPEHIIGYHSDSLIHSHTHTHTHTLDIHTIRCTRTAISTGNNLLTNTLTTVKVTKYLKRIYFLKFTQATPVVSLHKSEKRKKMAMCFALAFRYNDFRWLRDFFVKSLLKNLSYSPFLYLPQTGRNVSN